MRVLLMALLALAVFIVIGSLCIVAVICEQKRMGKGQEQATPGACGNQPAHHSANHAA